MKTPMFIKNVKFAAKAKSPQIKMVCAAVGIVGGVIWACKATLKAKTIIDTYEDEKADIEASEGSQGMARRNLVLLKDLGLTFAGPVVVIAGAFVTGYSGFNEQYKRTMGALAVAAGFQDTLTKYRTKVAGVIGEDKEADLYHGVEYKDIQTKGSDGKLKTIKKAPVMNKIPTSPLVVPFMDYDPNTEFGSKLYIEGRNDLNLLNIKNAQINANHVLKSRNKNFMTLAEVMKDYLRMDPRQLKDPTMAYTWGFPYKYGEGNDDNCIDFGVWDAYGDFANAESEEYARYMTRTLYLEFNAVPLFKIDDNYENRLTEFLGSGQPEYDK